MRDINKLSRTHSLKFCAGLVQALFSHTKVLLTQGVIRIPLSALLHNYFYDLFIFDKIFDGGKLLVANHCKSLS